jgi:quercetin dioxygenase-like cupin family protein
LPPARADGLRRQWRIRARVEAEWHEAAGGDNFIVVSNAEHEAEALEDSVVLDIFTPTREDYL